MSNPTTQYLVYRSPTTTFDLSVIFAPIGTSSPGPATGIYFYNTNTAQLADINTIFRQLTSSSQLKLTYLTNFKAPLYSVLQDLNEFFVAAPPFYVTPFNAYTYSYNTIYGYYTVVFADYLSSDPEYDQSTNIGYNGINSTLTFTGDVTNLTVTIIGGGGGGGGGQGYWANGGGGGGGGGAASFSLSSVSAGTIYPVAVGGGGGGGAPSNSSGLPASKNGGGGSPSGFGNTGAGGGGGGGGCLVYPGGAGGAGGSGGGSGGEGESSYPLQPNNSVSGGNGSTYTINAYVGTAAGTYTLAGGGAGGTGGKHTNAQGGLGGGGGGGTAQSTGNANIAFSGPNGIYYAQGYNAASSSWPGYGWPATGGGGGGGQGPKQASTAYYGGRGASGIVIACFKPS